MFTENDYQLQEVLCAFIFNPNLNAWDSTYFGKYYDAIQNLGFNEKQEQKGFELKFELKADANKKISEPQYNEAEPKMLFKNAEKNYAILMANSYVSFHKLPPYERWENMMKDQIKPGLEQYFKIGLGKDLLQVQMLYLNKYEFDEKEKLSSKFSFIPSIEDFGIGIEKNLLLQSQYDLEPNLLMQIQINARLTERKTKEVFLQCSCIAHNKAQKTNWEEIAQQVHDQNNLVFNKITKK